MNDRRPAAAFDERRLTGPRKAAILLLALPEEVASRVLAMMEEDEVRSVSAAMATLGRIPASVIEHLIVDFVDCFTAPGQGRVLKGDEVTTERLLSRILPPDKVREIMEQVRGPAGRTIWERLGNVDPKTFADFLKNEYPQTAAVVLSKMRPERAAKILALLPENFAMEVILRMLCMESVDKETLEHLERILQAEFMSSLVGRTKIDRHRAMAEIFNSLDREVGNRLMAALEDRNRDDAERVRSMMFTFDDLADLDPRSRDALVGAIQREVLALALKGAPPRVAEVLKAGMSKRVAKLLDDEIAAIGAVRVSDVRGAQATVLATARMLADRGDLVIPSSEDSTIE